MAGLSDQAAATARVDNGERLRYSGRPCSGGAGGRGKMCATGGARRKGGSHMPKMKTRKSVAKRFTRTGGGKFKRTMAGRRHLLSGKSRKRKRQLRRGALVSPADYKRIALALAVH